MTSSLQISLDDLSDQQLADYIFIDIREPFERMHLPVLSLGHKSWAMSKFEKECFPFDEQHTYVLYCAMGVRSLHVAEYCHQQGIKNVLSLIEGAEGINHFMSKKES